MVVNVLEGPLDVLRQQEVNMLVDLATALGEMGDVVQTDRQKLMDVAHDLREMFFLVVIIGEFNAGKSTFVNALLGDELLPMGITPTTEAIELIRYNEVPQRKPTLQENSLREWAHPNTGAPGVAIVDTPGTGSVFQKHETTAKAFLHRSDLVIFVVSAKRAFAETERLYLEMAKNYGKKIILVINQVDLLEPSELVQVRRFVEQQVKELLDIQPLTFTVSARESLKNRNNPSPTGDTSGMDAVRAHLRGSFNEATPARQKMLSQLDMAQSIVKHHLESVQSKVNLVSTDTARVKEVQTELQSQSIGMDSQLRKAREEVDKVFTGIRQRGLNFINTNLSIRLIGRAMSKEKLQAEFQEVVIGRALRDINEATNDYVNAVVDHSRTYWRGVIDRLNQLQEALEQEVGGLDAGVYAQQREGLQEAIRVAEAELKTYSTGNLVAEIQQTFENNMNGFTTSALAAVGGLVAVVAALAAPGAHVIGGGALLTTSLAFVIGAPV
ncbi:MAG TPA: dynamin family protein, partial [Phototrophicaceae bacterium]|nr:dynamin family protein [Phototrophicaceae bacterium]